MFAKIKNSLTLLTRAPDTPKSPTAPTPNGYFSPVKGEELVASSLRKDSLQKLWENSSLPVDVYRELYQRPVFDLLQCVQNVPASPGGRWSYAGSFGDLTLQFTTTAVRLSRGYMFPPGAAPEDQAKQSTVWQAVIFWSALFHHMPLLSVLQGEMLNGDGWQPGMSVPAHPYRFRFRKDLPPGGRAASLSSLAAARLLPANATTWLSATPDAVENLAGALWNGHPEMVLIRDVLKQAAELTESPLSQLQQHNTDDSGAVDALTSAMPPELAPETLQPMDTQISLASTLEPEIPPELATIEPGITLESEISRDSSIPAEDNSQHTELQASDTVEDDTDALISLFSELSESTKSELSPVSEVSGAEFSAQHSAPGSDMPSPSSEAVPETAAFPEMALTETKSLHYGQNDLINNNLGDVPEIKTGTVGNDGKTEADRFIEWLKEGISQETIYVNGAEDKLHVIAGYLFLPVPGIFFEYLKSSGKEASERDDVQASFERLNVHKRSDKKRFYSAKLYEIPGCEGKFKRVKGYLVKGRVIFGRKVPEDSQFLSFP